MKPIRYWAWEEWLTTGIALLAAAVAACIAVSFVLDIVILILLVITNIRSSL